MSESDSGDDFAIFARRRPTKAAASKQQSQSTQSGDALAPRTARPARKVESEARREQAAAASLLSTRNLARQMALGGVEALHQAEAHAVREAAEAAAQAAARSAASLPAPSVAAAGSAAAARDAVKPPTTLVEAYVAAMARENLSAAGDAFSVDASLVAWQRVFALGILERQAEAKLPDVARRDRALRAQMTSLSRQAHVYSRRGETRKAFLALEEIYKLASLLPRRDRATLQGLIPILRKAAELRGSVGSSEKAAENALLASEIEAALAKRATAVHAPEQRQHQPLVAEQQPPPAVHIEEVGVDAAAAAAEDTTESAAAVAAAKSKSSPGGTTDEAGQSAAASYNAEADAADGVDIDDGDEKDDASAIAAPAAAPALPSLEAVRALLLPPPDAAPDSAELIFLRAMEAAMFGPDFSLLRALMNRSLLGDAKARSALLERSVPGLGVTPAMVAAAGDSADTLRRLLGMVGGKAAVLQTVVHARDAAGNNAIMHAAACGSHRALDELLRSVHAAGGMPVVPVTGSVFVPLGIVAANTASTAPHLPAAAGSSSELAPAAAAAAASDAETAAGEAAARESVTVTTAKDILPMTYSAAVRLQLAAFAYDPQRYVNEFEVGPTGAPSIPTAATIAAPLSSNAGGAGGALSATAPRPPPLPQPQQLQLQPGATVFPPLPVGPPQLQLQRSPPLPVGPPPARPLGVASTSTSGVVLPAFTAPQSWMPLQQQQRHGLAIGAASTAAPLPQAGWVPSHALLGAALNAQNAASPLSVASGTLFSMALAMGIPPALALAMVSQSAAAVAAMATGPQQQQQQQRPASWATAQQQSYAAARLPQPPLPPSNAPQVNISGSSGRAPVPGSKATAAPQSGVKAAAAAAAPAGASASAPLQSKAPPGAAAAVVSASSSRGKKGSKKPAPVVVAKSSVPVVVTPAASSSVPVVVTPAASGGSAAAAAPASGGGGGGSGSTSSRPQPHVAYNVSVAAREGKLVGRALQPMDLSAPVSGGDGAGESLRAQARTATASAEAADTASVSISSSVARLSLLEGALEGDDGDEDDAAAAAAPTAAGVGGRVTSSKSKKARASTEAIASSSGKGEAAWDQFAANEKLFGVRATYNEELYTSKLDVSTFTPEQIAHATALADEIMASSDAAIDNPHVREERGLAPLGKEQDEEARFSAVVAASDAARGAAAGDAFTDAGVGGGGGKKPK